MTYGTPTERPSRRNGRLWLIAWLAASLAGLGLADLGVDSVYVSAWLVVFGWVAAEWSRNAWAWLLASLTMACHLTVAMGVAHGWSHEHAYAHTEEVSGFGPGIYVSYAVVSVWLLDGVLGALGAGPRWLHRAARGMVAFVMFNATVVYGTWPGKALGVAAFGGLAWVWWRRSRSISRRTSPRPSGLGRPTAGAFHPFPSGNSSRAS